MHVCTTCGSTFKDCVDFCFYDGEVLVPADAIAATSGAGVTPVPAPEQGEHWHGQGAQPTYDPEEPPELVEAAASEVSLDDDHPGRTPVPAPAASDGHQAPLAPSQVDTLTDINLDEVALEAQATPASSAPTLPPTPVPAEIAGDLPGDGYDPSEPYDAVPVAQLHDDPADPGEDTVPPVPVPSDNVGASVNDAPTQPGASPRPASRSPRPPPRAITFEAEEDDADRGRMIAIGAVALFLGLVFLVGAGAMAVTMGGNALLGDRGLADARPAVPPTPAASAPAPRAVPEAPTAAPGDLGEVGAETDTDGTADIATVDDSDAVAAVEPVPSPSPSPSPNPSPSPTTAPAPRPITAAVSAPAPALPVPPAPAPAAVQPAPAPTEVLVSVPAANARRIEIDSDPQGATVKMDGAVLGKTPLPIVSVPHGKRTFEFELAGHGATTVTANVDATSTPKVSSTLKAVPTSEFTVMVFLKDSSTGQLSVDGTIADMPMPSKLQLSPGKHTFEVRCRGLVVFSGDAMATRSALGGNAQINLNDQATNVTVSLLEGDRSLCRQ